MLRWLLVFACMTMAPEAASQGSYDSFTAGQIRFTAGDYRGAYDVWMPEAQAGSPRAQYSVGVLFEGGHGVQRDLVAAAKWYALAARQGYMPAETALRALAPKLERMLGKPVHDGPPAPAQKPANGKSA